MCSGQCFRCLTFHAVLLCGVAVRDGLQPSEVKRGQLACEEHGATTVKQTWQEWTSGQPTQCQCTSQKRPVPSKGCTRNLYRSPGTSKHPMEDQHTNVYFYTFDLQKMPDPKSCKCEEPCSKYGRRAKTPSFAKSHRIGACECSGRTTPSTGCGEPYKPQMFVMEDVPEPDSCKCLHPHEHAREQSIPVRVAALAFCSGVVNHVSQWVDMTRPNMLDRAPYLSTELCRGVLTGSVSGKGKWYSAAAQLSQHSDAEGWGHLDPLVKSPIQKHHLENVCKDECEDIVEETYQQLWMMYLEVEKSDAIKTIPFEATCADHVVRKVEAEILGCCGRSCGWNNRSCMLWPFFNKTDKADWLEECCTELNILEGSSRERMCNSVLSPAQKELVSKLDKKAKKGTDVGGAYTGQDRRLIWTAAGLSEFHDQLTNLESVLKKLKKLPKDGDLVDSEFLGQHKDVRQQGIKNGWFKEEEEMKGNKGTATAVLQTGGLADGCELTGMDPCHEDTKKLKIKTCMAGAVWETSDIPDPDVDEESCQMIRKNKAAIEVSTPDECLEASFSLEEFGKITRRFFEYKETVQKTVGNDLEDVLPDKPIMCYVESAQFTCGEFVREKFDQDTLDASKEFHDFRYWVNEKDVVKRLEQIKWWCSDAWWCSWGSKGLSLHSSIPDWKRMVLPICCVRN